jgi:hypothetical protein
VVSEDHHDLRPIKNAMAEFLLCYFVFVPGNQYDLRTIKNALADVFPHGEFLLSASNENDTY